MRTALASSSALLLRRLSRASAEIDPPGAAVPIGHQLDLGELADSAGGLPPECSTSAARSSSTNVLARRHGLNERQALAVEVLFEGGPIRIEELEALTRESTGAPCSATSRASSRGIAVANGAARATRYSLSPTYR